MKQPTPLSGIGDLEITLARAGRSHTLTGAELAAFVGSPGIVIRLVALLYAKTHPLQAGKEGATGEIEATRQRETNERNDQNRYLPNRSFQEEGCRGEGIHPCGQDADRIANWLADSLGDPKSLAFYRKLATTVPIEVIREALARTLDLALVHVRRSRAAYFTSLVMPHFRAAGPCS